jgi:hypothetical protein
MFVTNFATPTRRTEMGMSNIGILAALVGLVGMTVGVEEPRRRSRSAPKTPTFLREHEKRNRRKEMAKSSKKRNRGR